MGPGAAVHVSARARDSAGPETGPAGTLSHAGGQDQSRAHATLQRFLSAVVTTGNHGKISRIG